jgi:hypothetical protein
MHGVSQADSTLCWGCDCEKWAKKSKTKLENRDLDIGGGGLRHGNRDLIGGGA